MWWIRKDERIEQHASRLFHDAVALHSRGRSSEAAGKLEEAIGCSRQLAAKHPDKPIHNQATASALYLQARRISLIDALKRRWRRWMNANNSIGSWVGRECSMPAR